MANPSLYPPCDPSPTAPAEANWVEAILSGWEAEGKSQGWVEEIHPVFSGSTSVERVGDGKGADTWSIHAGGELLEWQPDAREWLPAEIPEKAKPGRGLQCIHPPTFSPLRQQDNIPEFDRVESPEARKQSLVPRRPIGKYLTLAGGIFLLTVLGLWTGGLLRMTREAPGKPDTATHTETSLPRTNPTLTAEMVPSMKELIGDFFEAGSLEEKATLVRGGKALLPVMSDYYSKHPCKPAEVKIDASVEFVNDGEREFARFTGRSMGGDPFEALVEKTAYGPRIDWRYLTGSGDMEWGEWIRARPSRPVMLCVIAALDDYYGGKFTDRQAWVCVKMTDIGKSSTVWGYAGRTSPIGTLLMRELRDRKRVLKFKGSFEFPPRPDTVTSLAYLTPQVTIRSVQSLHWIDRSPEVNQPEPSLLSAWSSPK